MTRVGRYNLDPSRLGFGYGVNGAMTQYVRVPARCLHRVPDNLPFEQACLTEPCAVAFNAVIENTRLKPADRVVVLGPGPIGILCAALARLSGAEVMVVGLERDRRRLAIAAQYGCSTIVGDAGEWARARDGLGADVVVDAAGVSETLASLKLDAVVLPYQAVPPPAITAESNSGDRSNNFTSATGLPGIIVPGGYTKDNLPVAIQFVGQSWTDLQLLQVAYAYEQNSKRRTPPATTPALPGEKFDY